MAYGYLKSEVYDDIDSTLLRATSFNVLNRARFTPFLPERPEFIELYRVNKLAKQIMRQLLTVSMLLQILRGD